ncbi:MAG: hypothetical protein IPK10_01220 [Bacteroidetes bacterium]|nr:hypothetical protein [Bacteroidota bacterium]
MKIIINLIGLILLFCTNLFGQQTTFQHIYRLGNNHFGTIIRELSNKNIIVGTRSVKPSVYQTMVWQLDSIGDTLNTFKICGLGVKGMEIDTQNKLIITGMHTACNVPLGGDVFISKVDLSGNELFKYTFGNNGIDSGTDILKENDSTFVIACYNDSYPDLLK